MEFSPRHHQPFTFSQAVELDASLITEEIARLQNSLEHLRRTQQELQDFLSDPLNNDEDRDIRDAVEHNDAVIASQTERIEMLRFALLHKGLDPSLSYTTNGGPASTADKERHQRLEESEDPLESQESEEDSAGLYL